ncbi:hypothetical protein [Neobacillus terrae]|uniref:hypothetical protein n=1 Tax=Neobacillus terrae TaxID=3034837 RepID=UPI00140C2928|nr:hypothetical protein [Neobacillus terrae]NHM31803.1 hypothetical protein [Neobacillus terrae]
MNQLAYLYLACILAGLALLKVAGGIGLVSGLGHLISIIAIVAVVVFAFAILYLGIRALLKK